MHLTLKTEATRPAAANLGDVESWAPDYLKREPAF
jgi:hypothetical protein